MKLHFPFLWFLLSSNPALDPAKRSHGHSVDSLCVLDGGWVEVVWMSHVHASPHHTCITWLS